MGIASRLGTPSLFAPPILRGQPSPRQILLIRRVGKGALFAPCPPCQRQEKMVGTQTVRAFARPVGFAHPTDLRAACDLTAPLGIMGPGAEAGTTVENPHRDKFRSKKFSAVLANTCMLASRSLLPVSSVIASCSEPDIPMQLWPAASP
jgi:hypothetical protein